MSLQKSDWQRWDNTVKVKETSQESSKNRVDGYFAKSGGERWKKSGLRVKTGSLTLLIVIPHEEKHEQPGHQNFPQTPGHSWPGEPKRIWLFLTGKQRLHLFKI